MRSFEVEKIYRCYSDNYQTRSYQYNLWQLYLHCKNLFPQKMLSLFQLWFLTKVKIYPKGCENPTKVVFSHLAFLPLVAKITHLFGALKYFLWMKIILIGQVG